MFSSTYRTKKLKLKLLPLIWSNIFYIYLRLAKEINKWHKRKLNEIFFYKEAILLQKPRDNVCIFICTNFTAAYIFCCSFF